MNQAQRLYHNPNFLGAQVLNAKYFQHTTLFTSTRNPRGSHIWKELFDEIQWLQEGMKWIVGDGQTIRIWDDHQILGDTLLVASKDRSCYMTKIVALVHRELIILGLLILSMFLSHHNQRNLSKVSLWHILPGFQIPLYGHIITVLAQLAQRQNFYITNNKCLRTSNFGTGFENYNAPKKIGRASCRERV